MENLRNWLDKTQTPITQFAASVGVSAAQVHYWLAGRNKPSAEKLIELSTVTGLTIDALLDHSKKAGR